MTNYQLKDIGYLGGILRGNVYHPRYHTLIYEIYPGSIILRTYYDQEILLSQQWYQPNTILRIAEVKGSRPLTASITLEGQSSRGYSCQLTILLQDLPLYLELHLLEPLTEERMLSLEYGLL